MEVRFYCHVDVINRCLTSQLNDLLRNMHRSLSFMIMSSPQCLDARSIYYDKVHRVSGFEIYLHVDRHMSLALHCWRATRLQHFN